MKTEEIMKDSAYNYKLTERDNGHLWDISDIFLKFIRNKAEAQNLSSNETLIYSKYKKLWINVDECRYLPVAYFIKTTHRKGRKERKAFQQESLCSLRLNSFSTPAHERTPPALIVHPRLSRAGG